MAPTAGNGPTTLCWAEAPFGVHPFIASNTVHAQRLWDALSVASVCGKPVDDPVHSKEDDR